jgi:hypothetical protein
MRWSYFEFLHHVISLFCTDVSVKPITLFFRAHEFVQTDAEFVGRKNEYIEEIFPSCILPSVFHPIISAGTLNKSPLRWRKAFL